MKVYFLISHPIQYYSPWFRSLALSTSLEVLYASDETVKGYLDKEFGTKIEWDIPLLEGYKSRFLKNYAYKKGIYNGFFGLFNLAIIKIVYNMNKNDVLIIHGWNKLTYWLAYLSCIFLDKKYILHAENPFNQELLKSSFNRKLKKIILYLIIKKAFRICYIGNQNKEFFIYYGADESQLIFTPYCVENERFKNTALSLRDGKSNFKKLFFPNNTNIEKVILFSGKYISKKRPLDLLKAYLQLNDPSIGLIFMGDGELRGELESEIKKNKIQDSVLLTGFVNQSLIGQYFTCADVFVLPSTLGETWGLVVNEAMNFSLPIIISNQVGSASDLVHKNGIIYTCGNIKELCNSLKTILYDDHLREEMGKESSNLIMNYSNSVRTINLMNSLS